MTWIGQLYVTERELPPLLPPGGTPEAAQQRRQREEQRKCWRQQRAGPVLTALQKWLPRNRSFERADSLAFLDESGFMLNPSVRRTLAPRGKTPVLEAWDRRDRISAISCVTLSPVLARPGLYFSLLPANRTVHAEDVVEFLEDLRGQLRGPFTVIWDRHKIHSKAKAVKAYLAEHPEVVAEDLPAYAPEANPDEWVWNWTKYGRLSNLAAQGGDELGDWIIESLIDLKLRPDLLIAFLHDAELPLAA